MSSRVSDFADSLLRHDWGPTAKMTKATISYILRMRIQHSREDFIESCEEMVRHGRHARANQTDIRLMCAPCDSFMHLLPSMRPSCFSVALPDQLSVTTRVLQHHLSQSDDTHSSSSVRLSEDEVAYAALLTPKSAHLYLVPIVELLTSRLARLHASQYSTDDMEEFFSDLLRLTKLLRTLAELLERLYSSRASGGTTTHVITIVLKHGRTIMDATTKHQGTETRHTERRRAAMVCMRLPVDAALSSLTHS